MGDTEASINFIITLANIFGIFPVSRKKVAGRKQLCFEWRSYTSYTLPDNCSMFLFFEYCIKFTFNDT